MKTDFDYIIVGQGLAGTTLAHIFLQQGKSVLVVDEQKEITASKVAAGIWNPVVFKRYTQTFLADELIQFNTTFYPAVEKTVGENFYHPRPYYKIFPNSDDVQHWQGKLNNSEVQQFLSPYIYTGLDKNTYNAPFDAAAIQQCGFLEVKKYLAATATYLNKTNNLLAEPFNYDELALPNNSVSYKHYTAQKIFFCQGLQTLQNPYLNQLPFLPVKGEILIIKAHLPENEAILNKSIFIVPIGNGLYKAGSTYNWQDLENTPTQKGKDFLVEKLQEILKVPFEIVEHYGAVRPAAKDRRPFVGLHPQHPQIGVLNGLGARGVMLAPYFAQQLANHLWHNSAIHPEVDVRRCFTK